MGKVSMPWKIDTKYQIIRKFNVKIISDIYHLALCGGYPFFPKAHSIQNVMIVHDHMQTLIVTLFCI